MPPIRLATTGRPFHIASATVSPKPSATLFCGHAPPRRRWSALTIAAFSSRSSIGSAARWTRARPGRLAPGARLLEHAGPRVVHRDPRAGDFSVDGHRTSSRVRPTARCDVPRSTATAPGSPASASRSARGCDVRSRAVCPRGDFSGDGKPDVLAVHPDGPLHAVSRQRRRRAGSPARRRDRSAAAAKAFDRARPSGGDFSGDGQPDVLADRPGRRACCSYRGQRRRRCGSAIPPARRRP